MKITIKTLQQKLFTVDVEPEDTVQAIKSKINEEQGHPVESQKLIYSGKVLDDSKVVKDCNFKEKDFLVLMVSKAKAATTTPAASTSAPSTSASVTTSEAPANPAPVERPAAVEPTPVNPTPVNPAPVETTNINPAPVNPDPVTATDTTNPATTETPATTTTAPTTAPATAEASAPSDPDFVMGSALESTITNMMELGFTREQCSRALRASFNNPERAVEYLFNGIPPGLLPETTSRAPATTAPTTAAGGGGMPSTTTPSTAIPAGGAAVNRPTAGAGSQNLFQMAQQQQQQRGAGLGGAGGGLGAGGLGGLAGARGLGGMGGLGGAGAGAGLGAGAAGLGGAGAPSAESLAAARQAIAENPALLQQAIQAILAENPALAQQINQNPELLYQMFAGGGEEGDDDGGPGAPMGMQPQTISVTPDEMAAIERLQALGFPRQAAAEAYFACGKNEELAANFLFEGGFGDD